MDINENETMTHDEIRDLIIDAITTGEHRKQRELWTPLMLDEMPSLPQSTLDAIEARRRAWLKLCQESR
jgi:hypothetical protein